jgi:hypothetical protein
MKNRPEADFILCKRKGSNLRPPEYQSGALPTELRLQLELLYPSKKVLLLPLQTKTPFRGVFVVLPYFAKGYEGSVKKM